MGRVEGSSKLCAFCTKCTAYSIPSWIGAGILHRFYSEFLTNSTSVSKRIIKVNCKSKRLKSTGQKGKSIKNNVDEIDPFPPPPENWTVCGQCLPYIQSALASKENVNKVECQVRKLQVELLKCLQNLMVETDKMCETLKDIEQIAVEKPAKKGGFVDIAAILVGGGTPSLKKQEEQFFGQFKQKITTVIRDIKVFEKGTSTKLLKNIDDDQPPIKVGRMDSHKDTDINSSLKKSNEFSNDISNVPSCLTPSSAVSASGDVEVGPPMSHLLSGDDDSSNLVIQSRSQNGESEGRSKFRINLIKRINLGRTIATSKNLPVSLDDPRHSYSIEHSQSGSDSKFFVQDTEIIVVEEGLQCGTCHFKVEVSPLLSPAKPQSSKRWNIEDKLFEHILSKHLNLYTCSICGESSETFLNWRAHKQVHFKKLPKRKSNSSFQVKNKSIRKKYK